MPEGLGRFQKKRLGNSDDQVLWNAIEHIERHLSLLPGTPAVQLDEATGGVSSQDGTPLDFGGGGDSGGGGGGGGSHTILSPTHIDTEPADLVAGDLLYANASALLERLGIGASTRVVKSDGSLPAWGQVAHSELSGVTADQHHNQAHALDGADHTLSGAVAGHIMAATAATTFALQAPGTQVIRAGTTAARPAATTVPAGTLYLATDDDGGTLFRSDGTNWVQCGLGVSESSSGGAPDSASYVTTAAESGLSNEKVLGTTVIQAGVYASRPAASSVAAGTLYLDTTNLQLYRSDASAWAKCGAPALSSSVLAAFTVNDFNGWSTSYALMNNAWTDGASRNYPVRSYAAGFLVGMSVQLNGDIGGAGVNLDFRVYVNGSFVGETMQLTGGAGTEDGTQLDWTTDVPIVAGDEVQVYAQRTGTIGAGTRGTVYVFWRYGGGE